VNQLHFLPILPPGKEPFVTCQWGKRPVGFSVDLNVVVI